MSEGASDKEWREGSQAPARPGMPVLVCYVCGSEDLSGEKCKVRCRKCHALIENCSGD